jgi:lipid-binding SYLF domain-containing protein
MKRVLACLLFASLAASALAVDKADLDNRLRKLSFNFDNLQAKPDKRIPAETLRKAQGIILLDRTKAGLIFAYQGGSGAAMVKDPKSGQWSPVTFLSASEASLGFLVGGQHSFVVILLMSTNATQMLTEPSFKFGGEASGTAGNSSGGHEGAVNSTEQLTLIYTDTSGLYGGAAVKGGSLSPDTEADTAYYGQFLSAKEILFDHKVKPTEAATQLARKITEYTK